MPSARHKDSNIILTVQLRTYPKPSSRKRPCTFWSMEPKYTFFVYAFSVPTTNHNPKVAVEAVSLF